MGHHFKNIAYAVGHEYKGARNNQTLKNTSYVEFINREVSDSVISTIKTTNLDCVNAKNVKLIIAKSKTAAQKERWYFMNIAEELIKKDVLSAGAAVSIESKMPVRKVLVTKNGEAVVAFEQNKDDLRGEFKGPYCNLEFDNL